MVQIFERYLEHQFQATITLRVLPLTTKLHLGPFQLYLLKVIHVKWWSCQKSTDPCNFYFKENTLDR